MSLTLYTSIEPDGDELEGLRQRMIREVEFFLEGSSDRAGWPRVISTLVRLKSSPRSVDRSSWYDRPGSSKSSGESAPC